MPSAFAFENAVLSAHANAREPRELTHSAGSIDAPAVALSSALRRGSASGCRALWINCAGRGSFRHAERCTPGERSGGGVP